jgi:hypothetical protein
VPRGAGRPTRPGVARVRVCVLVCTREPAIPCLRRVGRHDFVVAPRSRTSTTPFELVAPREPNLASLVSLVLSRMMGTCLFLLLHIIRPVRDDRLFRLNLLWAQKRPYLSPCPHLGCKKVDVIDDMAGRRNHLFSCFFYFHLLYTLCIDN